MDTKNKSKNCISQLESTEKHRYLQRSKVKTLYTNNILGDPERKNKTQYSFGITKNKRKPVSLTKGHTGD